MLVYSLKALKVITLLVVACGIPVALWEGYRFLPRTSGGVPSPSYAETVTITLAALTIMLGFLALIVAVLAVWGYQGIRGEANNAAQRAVNEAVGKAIKEHLSEKVIEAKVGSSLKARIDKAVSRALDKLPEILPDYPAAFPQENGELLEPETTEHIAEEYPNETPNENS